MSAIHSPIADIPPVGAFPSDIWFTHFQTGVGVVLVAAAPGGICSVRLGDDARELEKALREDLRTATSVTYDPFGTKRAEKAIRAFLAGARSHTKLALDPRATLFQRRVWAVLQAIPRGERRSYADIARQLGKPGGARAVGRACASNEIALLIPCHRAVGSDGSLRGYRWGVHRKAALLELEKGAVPGERQNVPLESSPDSVAVKAQYDAKVRHSA